ncbi:glycosyltransferase family 2 protein [soil metagenome]
MTETWRGSNLSEDSNPSKSTDCSVDTDCKVGSIGIVVPAHNEAACIEQCLRAVEIARANLLRSQVPRTVVACIALDRCTDRTPAIVEAWAAGRDWLLAITCHHCGVGAARRDAVAAIEGHLATGGPVDPAKVWVASTDADSLVPADWLLHHAEAADLGVDLLLGRVTPDVIGDEAEAETDARLLALWRNRHPDDLATVHGANLGIRLSIYRDAGGFPPLSAHEDVALVEAVRARTDRIAHGSSVRTSSRLRGRAPAGFAHYLRTLAGELDRP